MSAINKMIVVPKNGQISIGKSFAGKTVQIVEVQEGQLLITQGNFVPAHMKTFFTEEANQKLNAFNEHILANQDLEKSSDEVFSKIEKERAKKT